MFANHTFTLGKVANPSGDHLDIKRIACIDKCLQRP